MTGAQGKKNLLGSVAAREERHQYAKSFCSESSDIQSSFPAGFDIDSLTDWRD
jgi:hypothetical protein